VRGGQRSQTLSSPGEQNKHTGVFKASHWAPHLRERERERLSDVVLLPDKEASLCRLTLNHKASWVMAPGLHEEEPGLLSGFTSGTEATPSAPRPRVRHRGHASGTEATRPAPRQRVRHRGHASGTEATLHETERRVYSGRRRARIETRD